MNAPRTAFVFPGQGSQKVGMGRAWAERSPAARAAFDEASEALGLDLRRLCWEGPESELRLTANTQPAILVASVAVHRALVEEGRDVAVAMAGHSLGEYAAHVAAGTLALADAARLVRLRGELMQDAVPDGVGAMAAVIGLDAAAVAEVAQEAAAGEVCAVANYNAPEQTVIAGHRAAVERALVLAKARGAKRALALPVSAPFHCALMAPAREGLRAALEAAPFAAPRVPVVVNVDARAVTSGEEARSALVRQVDSAVLWVDSVRHLWESLAVRRFVEVGPGNVLGGLVRRIVPEAETITLAEPEALERWANG